MGALRRALLAFAPLALLALAGTGCGGARGARGARGVPMPEAPPAPPARGVGAFEATLVLASDSFTVRDRRVAVERGTLRVPQRRSDRSAGALALHVVRFPSTAAAPGAPIVFLAGGPGDAATRAFATMPSMILDSLRAIADVIAMDQRGTGLSEPRLMTCPPVQPLPLDRPLTADAYGAAARADAARCVQLMAERGVRLAGFTTAESADDLEALRQALGAPALALLGGSYGTHLALATARRHPASVSRMVLAGVEGPDHTFKLPTQAQAVLERLAAMAARDPALGDAGRELLPRLERAIARLDRAPVTVSLPPSTTIAVGGWDLRRMVSDALGDVARMRRLPALLAALEAGDHTELARWALGFRRPRPTNAMKLAMDCASHASPARLARIAAEAPLTVLGDVVNAPLPAMCAVAGLPRLGDAFRAPLASAVPALLVSGSLDARTPPANAVEVARDLPHARLLLVAHAGHALLGDPVVTREMLRFLRGEEPTAERVERAFRFAAPR